MLGAIPFFALANKKKCPNCGKRVSRKSEYCTNCGEMMSGNSVGGNYL
ncbi:MAG: zinc-ribbon domain-containing protein [Anaerolineales bacterium]|nr:zinc-ribbon domain-containing protein [Anaerolineales bacterium]